MSFENKNLYHLLGNDVEDEEAPIVTPREVVKKTSTSKKSDVPPPSADPSKAKKKSKPTGNEAAFKDRTDNKSVPTPANTNPKHQKKPFDRHSRSNKNDSSKKLKQGWGSADTEAQAELDAEEDAREELKDEEEGVQTEKKSLQEYFQELELKQQELSGQKKVRQPNEGQESKWTASQEIKKQQESYVEGSSQKKGKGKSQKEKKFLDFEATFADETPSDSRRGNFSGRGSRGGKRGNFGSKRGAKSSQKPKPAIDDKNFPSL